MMIQAIKKLLSRRREADRPKPLGQSLVEFTLMLPVLMIMISGLVEFGFLLNQYLDLTDAAREAARLAVDSDIIHDPAGNYYDPNDPFYVNLQDFTLDALARGSGGQVSLDSSTNDNIIISSFEIVGGVVHTRYPVSYPNGVSWNSGSTHTTGISTADVNARMSTLTDVPNSGLVLVEIYYEYNMILELPWITMFVPNPIMLHAYAFMPNASVAPTPVY
jgi:Flp pilus assembly protein TadG